MTKIPRIKIVDKPCGYGKSTEIMRSFDKRQKYIVVGQYLTEVQRFIDEALMHSGFLLTAPNAADCRKRDHCEKLILDGKSVACTHALFYRLGTLATQTPGVIKDVKWNGTGAPELTIKHLLDDYNIIIDEVVDPLDSESAVRIVNFNMDYIDLGMARVLPDGRVEPTELWDKRYDAGADTFSPDLYQKAKSGALYKLNDKLFIITIPVELLLRPKSVTIYTYLSEGSLLLRFLRKLQAERPGEFTLEVEKLDGNAEAEWRNDVAQALTVKSIPGLEELPWNYTAQLKNIKTHSECVALGNQIRKFRDTDLRDVPLSEVMLCSARDLWFKSKSGQKPAAGRLAKHTRMFGRPKSKEVFSVDHKNYDQEWETDGVQFVPNTTRGTNKHSHCKHAVYLYDQNPKPELLTFLKLARDSEEARDFCNAYALTELAQWLFRSAIRRGGINGTGQNNGPREKVTVYIPSERMRSLLLHWLKTGKVMSSGTPPQRSKQSPARNTGLRKKQLRGALDRMLANTTPVV